MKKYLFVMLLILCGIVISGCTDDHEKQQMEDRISQLEQQVTDLEAGQKDDPEVSAGAVIPKEDEYGLTALKNEIEASIKNGENAVPTGGSVEQRDQFFTLKSDLKKQEQRLDQVEDQLENDYKNQRLTYEKYRNYEKVLDQLDDQLDRAGDSLENKFGIHD